MVFEAARGIAAAMDIEVVPVAVPEEAKGIEVADKEVPEEVVE